MTRVRHRRPPQSVHRLRAGHAEARVDGPQIGPPATRTSVGCSGVATKRLVRAAWEQHRVPSARSFNASASGGDSVAWHHLERTHAEAFVFPTNEPFSSVCEADGAGQSSFAPRGRDTGRRGYQSIRV